MSKKQAFDGKLFAHYLKKKRIVDLKNNINISLGDASKLSGISKATLSRLEREATPDISTFATLCNWIEQPMALFFKTVKPSSKKQ